MLRCLNEYLLFLFLNCVFFGCFDFMVGCMDYMIFDDVLFVIGNIIMLFSCKFFELLINVLKLIKMFLNILNICIYV